LRRIEEEVNKETRIDVSRLYVGLLYAAYILPVLAAVLGRIYGAAVEGALLFATLVCLTFFVFLSDAIDEEEVG